MKPLTHPMNGTSGPLGQPVRGDWAVERTARLSRRYSVTMTCGPGGYVCEWSPEVPKTGLSHRETRRYYEARHALLEEVARRLGGNILVVEATGGAR